MIYDPVEYSTPQIKVTTDLHVYRNDGLNKLKPTRVIIYNDDVNFKYHRWELRDVDIPCVQQLMIIMKNLFFISRMFIITTFTENPTEALRQEHKLRALLIKLDNLKIEKASVLLEPTLLRHYYINNRFEPFITHKNDLRTFVNEIKAIILKILQIDFDIEDTVIRLCNVVDFINAYHSYMTTLIRHYEDFYVGLRMLRDVFNYSKVRTNETLFVIESEEITNLAITLSFLPDKLYLPFTNNDVLVFSS